MNSLLPALCVLVLCCHSAPGQQSPEPASLSTVAEQSDYTATATYQQVLDFADQLVADTPFIQQASLGTTVEGRDIPMLILADPPSAYREPGDRLRVFAFGNIHAGEVCGKEALLAFARDIAQNPADPLHRALLDHCVLVIAPIYNPDGNERFDTVETNRPGQVGPQRVGQRPNAQGLDLNRDYVKLEAPETRALVRFINSFDPHVTVDTHTTNGSHHRYTLTFDYPLNPSGYLPLIEFARDEYLPAVSQRMLDRTGYRTFFYGNFNEDKTAWHTYSAMPRYGGPYMGLCGRMQILSEACSYVPFKDRVLATEAFVRELIVYALEHRGRIIAMHDEARRVTVSAGENPQPDDLVGIRHTPAAAPRTTTLLGYAPDGTTPRDIPMMHYDRFAPSHSVRRPFAYIIEAHDALAPVIDNLRAHGVMVKPFTGEALVETYTIRQMKHADREFQGHRNVLVEADAALVTHVFEDGAVIVHTAQPLGTLIVYLLEPESEDGLVAWNFLDDFLNPGGRYPVHRVRARPDIH